jgi:hypothetical protein
MGIAMTKALLELEKLGWDALSTTREAAQAFYGTLLADEAVTIFPGGMMIAGKDEILESIDAQPWESFHIEAPQVIMLAGDAGAVVYRVTAQRAGPDPYVALISSVYTLQEGDWKLALHQQTPV